MKKLFLLLTGITACLTVLPQTKPGKPAFVVTYEESGKNMNDSWHYSAIIKFSLSNWNGYLYGRSWSKDDRTIPLVLNPIAILKLEPGQKINFYPSEVDEKGSGSGGSYTRVLGTDGVETIVEKTSDGTRTTTVTDADYRREHNIPLNEVYCLNARFYQLGELAELERTETGAILYAYTAVGNNLSEWSVSEETMYQVFPDVETFVFTENDIKAWQQISRTNVKSGSNNDESLTVKLSVKMQVEKTDVTLEACSDLGVGEQKQVTATGSPDGGSYRFWTEPEGILSISAGGGTATLTGAEPGRGTLYAEYTSPDGAQAQVSQPVTCVRVNSYNNGVAIPRIVIYDLEGTRLVEKITVPVDMEPEDANEMVDFILGNNSIFSVESFRNAVELTPKEEGSTTLEAKTTCGGTTGPVITVEFVYCDEETKAQLREMMRTATEAQQNIYKVLGEIRNSEDFVRASDRLASSAGNLAIKVGGAIIGSLSGGSADAKVKLSSKIYGVGSNLLDFVTGLAEGENLGTVSNLSQMVVELGGSDNQQALASAIETIQAAKDFGDDLGAMMAANEKLRGAEKWADKWNRDIIDIVRRLGLCHCKSENNGTTTDTPGKDQQAQGDDKQGAQNVDSGQKADNNKGEADKDAGRNDDQDADADTDRQAEDNADQGDESSEISPPPPTSEPRQMGLPYMPGSDCGCNEPRGITVTQTGLAEMNKGLKNLNECVETFSNGPLNDYIKALEGWKAVSESLSLAIQQGPESLKKTAKESLSQIENLLGTTKAFEEQGKAFLEVFNACPESMQTAVDLMNEALTITIDMVKTKY